MHVLPSSTARRGFTLIELLIVIAIIAILAAMLLPVLESAQERAKRAQCVNDLRQNAIAISIYCSDNSDFMPPLKWRDQNIDYSYLLFEYAPQNVAPPTFTDGPYNLGILWNQNLLGAGQILYCPSISPVPGDPNYEYTSAYYAQTMAWPTGRNAATAADSNPSWVRAGYSYLPSSKVTQLITVDGFGRQQVPMWQPYTSSPQPYQSESVVPLFKQSAIDISKSTVVDLVRNSQSYLAHKNHNSAAGLNAAFGDGHVKWQNIRSNPSIFSSTAANGLWTGVATGSGAQQGEDFRFLMSLFQP